MKKQKQLGMNPSTASGRLVKDILYALVVETERNTCYHCGQPMSRETFSIEHKTPWLDSENPVELYFSLDNIGFSHKSCNARAARRKQAEHGTTTKYNLHRCRCNLCISARAKDRATRYTKERRQETYRRTGH